MMKMSKVDEIGREALELYKSLTPEPALANESGVVERLKQDWVVLGLRYFPYQLKKILSEIAGEEITADCFYKFGYGCGKEICNRYVKLGKKGKDAVIFTIAGSTYFGWGPVEIVELTPERAILKVYNSFEARSYFANNKEEASKPQCHFFRGVATATCTVSWSTEGEGKETKCLAMGDEFCEFIITPKKY